VSYEYNVWLKGVSCSSASFCVAVGLYRTGPSTFHSFVERYNGEQWSIASNPGNESELLDISCIGEGAPECTAVGYRIIYRFNGLLWSSQSFPGEGELRSVSCPALTECVASGAKENVPFAIIWDGSKWSVSSPVNPAEGEEPAGKGGVLFGVSCAAVENCAAVGEHAVSSGRWRTLAEMYK
jgi:hypothetical protein